MIEYVYISQIWTDFEKKKMILRTNHVFNAIKKVKKKISKNLLNLVIYNFQNRYENTFR